MTFTRMSDRWKRPATIAGFAILIIFGALLLAVPKDRQPSDAVKYVTLIVGAGLISPGFIIDLIRAYRGNKTITEEHPLEPPVPR